MALRGWGYWRACARARAMPYHAVPRHATPWPMIIHRRVRMIVLCMLMITIRTRMRMLLVRRMLRVPMMIMLAMAMHIMVLLMVAAMRVLAMRTCMFMVAMVVMARMVLRVFRVFRVCMVVMVLATRMLLARLILTMLLVRMITIVVGVTPTPTPTLAGLERGAQPLHPTMRRLWRRKVSVHAQQCCTRVVVYALAVRHSGAWLRQPRACLSRARAARTVANMPFAARPRHPGPGVSLV